MKKLDIINRLRESKKAHMTWVSHAHALVEGLAVDEDKVPVHGTECNFGGWYYNDGQVLSQLQEFQLIEEPHLELHDLYLKIHKHFQVRYQADDSSIIGRLFGSNKKLVAEKAAAEAQIQALFMRLKMVSKDIATKLDALANKIVAMSDDNFDALLRTQGINIKADTSVIHFRRADRK